MKRILIILILLAQASVIFAQKNYDASLISKDLLPYASAVIRNEEVSIEVKGLDNVIYHVKQAITVLNKNGDDIAHMAVWYNKSNSIRYIKGSVYDEFGKQIVKFGESDFEDVSAVHDFSLFEDSRLKHYIPSITNYPYTLEYEYEVRSKQSLTFRTWQPNPYTGLAVEKSSFTFICKPDFNIRYKETHIPGQVIIGTNKDGLKTYTWQVQNLKAVKHEAYSPDEDTYLGSVRIAPEKFVYEGMSGSFTNWQQLGKWEYDKLLMNRWAIPAETADHIREITAGIADPKLKAKKIYEYMQQKTHYISVQIGVGGYQPFLASDVDKLNYGDCKALVNYTQSLLKLVNIDSWYCVVESGRTHKVSLTDDFASMNQGNHIILCIPFKNDTTWLECTNQQMPFGYLGDFTDDRTVLACTPEGGKLLHTPKYTTEENLEKRKADFIISENGELSGNMETMFKGTDYDDRNRVIEEAQTERVKDIKRYYPINNLDIVRLEYKQDKNVMPATVENIKLSASDYAAVSNGKLNFSLNSVNRAGSAPPMIRNRVNQVHITRGYTEEDEITYTLPNGYKPDSEPLKIDIEKPFGNFSTSMKIDGNRLIYKRKLQVKDGTYSKDMYQELVDFYQSVADADSYNVSLVKN